MADWGFREFRQAFFDARKILDQAEAGERRVLSRFGAFAWRRARSSIRPAPLIDAATGLVTRKRRGVKTRPATAPPGRPPYSHEGSLRRLLFFGHDPAARSVVVGPVRFRRGEAPRLLEHGGDVTRGGRRLHYAGNPVSAPAALAELPRFPELIRNMVR